MKLGGGRREEGWRSVGGWKVKVEQALHGKVLYQMISQGIVL
jgi:hypothetical protein